jgi:hypothetical protein
MPLPAEVAIAVFLDMGRGGYTLRQQFDVRRRLVKQLLKRLNQIDPE